MRDIETAVDCIGTEVEQVLDIIFLGLEILSGTVVVEMAANVGDEDVCEDLIVRFDPVGYVIGLG